MKIHEYQAKELLRAYGAPVEDGVVVTSVADVPAAVAKLSGSAFVVKAQVHSGGRGKAGGVKFCPTPEAAVQNAGKILGMQLVTEQTGASGKLVTKLLIEKAASIAKEYYVSLTVDAAAECFVIIASAAGGTEIEEIAHAHPEQIITQPFSLATGLRDYHARIVASKIGIVPANVKEFCALLKSMYKLFTDKDCSLLEINPLVLTSAGTLLAVDAKMNFDDNAIFRHADILALRDAAEEDAKEAEASENGLSFVSLEGNIGCMVNGAGLAMATMDIIKSCGGAPANFLDVGGSASAQKVAAAFKILLRDPNLRAIFVNIFGGIMKCDVIAEGIITAAREVKLDVPLVVRLDGTNVAKGKEILAASGLDILSADDMGTAAKIAVAQT